MNVTAIIIAAAVIAATGIIVGIGLGLSVRSLRLR